MEKKVDFNVVKDRMDRWISHPKMLPELKRELEALAHKLESDSEKEEAREEIYERFYKDLDFGTGGLRGILGAGTNRMNVYTVRHVTQGFANYIKENYGKEGEEISFAIAYDSRNYSTEFAYEAAKVLAANGIKVYIYRELMPTPALSFAVRHFKCAGGIMITASHNPADYNGYKVYNHEGCQVTDKAADEILKSIRSLDILEDIKVENIEIEDQDIRVIPEELVDKYIEAVKETGLGTDCEDLEVVFTPLNGAGNKSVRRVLKEIGLGKVHVVPEQEKPDGNFPTCPYPNPEKEEALRLGLELCKKLKTPDLLLATDPDCDRLGLAVRHEDESSGNTEYKRLSGNEIGVLLLDFLCEKRSLPEKPIAMKTIVSTKMTDELAKNYGVEVKSLLTGFKYIGEQIGILERKGQEDRFIFGFEESYGYLGGPYVRDKDAVNAAMLICEVAAYYKKQKKTLVDRMKELYNTYGWYLNDLLEYTFEGAAGMRKMSDILNKLRENPPKELIGYEVTENIDYKTGQHGLPSSNVLEYILEEGSSIIIRPSGTEPKLKIYLSSKGRDELGSKETIEKLKDEIGELIL